MSCNREVRPTENELRPTEWAKSWKDLVDLERGFASPSQDLVFRGQTGPQWRLKTTLDRACETLGVEARDIPELEKNYLFQDFKRSYAIHSPHLIPREDDTILWLSLMRHYGAPTRLLDFTFSFCVACYFALEDASGDSAVWVISKTWLTREGERLLKERGFDRKFFESWRRREGKAYEKAFWDLEPPLRFVWATNPYILHQRLQTQQALHLSPGDVTLDFQQNLMAMKPSKADVLIVGLRASCRVELLEGLRRAGVNRSVLFPGLDGFAQSLRTKLALYLKLMGMEDTGARHRYFGRWAPPR
jgi:hypothetical protein